VNRFLISTASLALLSSTALAADLPVYQPAPEAIATAAVYDWSGVYVGLQGGYAWGHDDYVVSGTPFDFDVDGAFVGGHVGANFQWSSFVAGIEADLEWANIEGSRINIVGNSAGTDLNWQGSLRGRLGFALDRVLIYGTGGLAFASTENSISDGFTTETEDDTRFGWTLGAGLDVAVTQNVIAGVEYRYTDFGSETYDSVLFPGDTFESDLSTHTVRARLSYKF
jgi:outer membrane immunogenic protein